MRCNLLVGLVGCLCAATGARGQTLFEEPASRIDATQYTTIEACLSAADRTRDSIRWGVRRDTLVYDATQPDVAEAVRTAYGCAARFTLDNTPRRDWAALMRLLVLSGRDGEARTLHERRIKGVPAGQTAEHVAILDDGLTVYMSARPIRLDDARRIVAELDSIAPGETHARMDAHLRLLMHARAMLDVELIRTEATTWNMLALRLPDSTRRTSRVLQQAIMVADAFAYAMLREVGVDSTLRYMRRRLDALLGADLVAQLFDVPGALGTKGVPISSDYWFPMAAATRSYPVLGKITAFVYVDNRCAVNCLPGYVILQRLHRTYGDALEILLVAKTAGYFRTAPLPGPAEEAEWMRKYFLEYHNLPGALAVSNTPFTRRTEPDRRRVDGTVASFEQYQISPQVPAAPLMVLVDQRGIVVAKQSLSPFTERMVNRMLMVLTAPPPTSP